MWNVPSLDANGMVTFVLREYPNPANAELAHIEIPVATRRSDDSPLIGSTANDFVVPTIGQTGAPLPIVGPFGGDARDAIFTTNGAGATVLSVSTRVAFVQLPAGPAGQVNYELRKGAVMKHGALRLLGISVSHPGSTRVKKGDLVTDVKGLTARPGRASHSARGEFVTR